MRLVLLDVLQPATVVGADIIGIDGRLLVRAGNILSAQAIVWLKRNHIHSVVVNDDWSRSIRYESTVPQHIVSALIDLVASIHATVRSGKLDQMRLLRRHAESVLGQVQTAIAIQALKRIELIRPGRTAPLLVYETANAVLLSLCLALHLNQAEFSLKVGIGALFCDTGLLRLPESVLAQGSGPKQRVAPHPQEHLSQSLTHLEHFGSPSPVANMIVTQHEECMDGSGYLQGLKGDEINPLSRLVSVANTLAHLIVVEGCAFAEAMEYMQLIGGTRLDQKVVGLIGKAVIPYPLGSLIRLSTGEIAMVQTILPGNELRPHVRKVVDESDRPIRHSPVIDLSDPSNCGLVIQGVVDDL